MRAQNKLTVGQFDVFDGTAVVLADGIRVVFALAIRGKRVVMAIDEESGARCYAWVHARGLPGVRFEDDETLPAFTVAFDRPA